MSPAMASTAIPTTSAEKRAEADSRTLLDGATFLYLIAQARAAAGAVLEDRVVNPDLAVAVDRDALLAGIDSQLEGAFQYLLEANPQSQE